MGLALAHQGSPRVPLVEEGTVSQRLYPPRLIAPSALKSLPVSTSQLPTALQ